MKQVERGHWSNEAKEYYYAKRAAALGVRTKAEEPACIQMIQALRHRKNTLMPLGSVVQQSQDGRKTDKEIMSDPELAEKATTPEGYKEAKKVVRDRRETVERKGLLYALAPLK